MIGHTDTRLPSAAKPRLGGQNGKILARLRRGSATNDQLEECSGSKRINSRVADCRKFLQEHEGNTITSKAVDTARGIYEYEIKPIQL